MDSFRYLYGPVPSRRLGASLGVSPIPPKTCNYSCIYCQLGRTSRIQTHREIFFPVEDILVELDRYLEKAPVPDAVTVVGEGEPTLYAGLGRLLEGIRSRVTVPVVVITNGALLGDPGVARELEQAHIVMPSLDAWDPESFRRINRPARSISFSEVLEGLQSFSRNWRGQLWLEIMLLAGISDSPEALEKFRILLQGIRTDRIWLNTPVRPPAESSARVVDHRTMEEACRILSALNMDLLVSGTFFSAIADPLEALHSILTRHPMTTGEIRGFLEGRGEMDPDTLLEKLQEDPSIEKVSAGGPETFRIRPGRK